MITTRSGSEQTMRERMLAVVRGEEHDRVPFVTYDCDNLAILTGFPSRQEVCELLGRENVGFAQLVGLYRFETPNCRFATERFTRDGKDGERRILHTPAGDLFEEKLFLTAMNAMAQGCRFVKQPEDYSIMLAYLRDVHVVKDVDTYHDSVTDLGENGLPMCYLPKTPYQQLWIEWVDIQDLVSHLTEHPDIMQEVFYALEDVQGRVYETVREVVRDEPISHLVVGENLTAPMIGEHYFRAYSLPAYNRMAGMLDETGKDVPLMIHADGDILPLWDAIGESRLRGLESLTPPPNGDTSVAKAIARWPDMRLLVNFPSSVHLAEPEEIYRTTMDILHDGDRLGRLQIQISEDPPPNAWRKSYPAIVKAIQDFGPACSG